MSPRSIFGIRVSMLVHLYVRRLRLHTVQELLAGAGIAVGVGLVFGVLLANSSVLGATEDTVHGVIGTARLELSSRSSTGFDQRVANEVRRLPGVQSAAALLQESASVVGPRGRAHVQLVGVTPAVVTLGGSIPRGVSVGPSMVAEGLALPSAIAQAIGARPEQQVVVLADGTAHSAHVNLVAGTDLLGAAASSPIVVTLIGVAQRLTDREGRVTQVLVRPLPGRDRVVEQELRRMAQGRLDVGPANGELTLLRQIAEPGAQATNMFALIGGMVGFLFTFNAMLLTVPERRRYLADLRMQGYDRRQVLVILGFDALVLGVVSSAVGVVLGYMTSHLVFHSVPVYLAFAFPIGSEQTVHLAMVVLAVGCGTLATLLASLLPVFDLRTTVVRDAIFRSGENAADGIADSVAWRMGVGGLATLIASTVAVVLTPSFSLIGGVCLALATILFIPAVFVITARILSGISYRSHSSALALTVRELRITSMPVIALAAVGAIAIYGSVAVQGARRDLIAGLNTNFVEYLSTADLWVTSGGNNLTTNSFEAGTLQHRLAELVQVHSVRAYRGGLLDIGRRRMWIIGRPSADRSVVPASQLLSGHLKSADERLREGRGWVAISSGFASEHHLRVEEIFPLPTPSGEQPVKVAAVITNIGWPPGAIVMNSLDYSRFWQSRDPSALEIDLKPGVSEAEGKRAVQGALSARPGLVVQTRKEREAQYKGNAREAVATLAEISLLLLIAAAFAVASALSAVIWRRRAQLASLKVQGYDRNQLWRAVLLESMVVLGVGCAVGAMLGVYGHALATRWLVLSTGFRANFSLGLPQMLLDVGLVASIAMIVISLPGFIAARVSPRLALQE